MNTPQDFQESPKSGLPLGLILAVAVLAVCLMLSAAGTGAALLLRQPEQPALLQAPSIILAPVQAAPGEVVIINGSGWVPYTSVSLFLTAPNGVESGPVSSWASGAEGKFSIKFLVPLSGLGWDSSGVAMVTVRTPDGRASAQATLTIAAATPQAATNTPVPGAPTDTPTVTPQPTNTPFLWTPPAPEAPACTNGNQNLNVRSGPGMNYPVVTWLRPGQTVGVSGQNMARTWWRIQEGQWVAADGYCLGNAAAASVPVFPDPPTPTPTSTPTSTNTPTPGAPCGGCRNTSDPTACHPVDLQIPVPSGAYCIARGWWDSPTETGRVLLEAPLLAGDQPRGTKPLRYEGWFAMEPDIAHDSGFTNITTQTQVIADDHLWGKIIDQVPDETQHWWWPSSAPITLTIGIAPEGHTTNAAWQQFPGGLMIWREDTKKIYVLYYYYNTQRIVGTYEDTFKDGDPAYACPRAEANGAAGPLRGFGKLWCSSAQLQQQLGLPSSPERGYVMEVQENILFDPDGTAYNLTGSTWTSSYTLPNCSWDGVVYCRGQNCSGGGGLACIKPTLTLGYVLPGWCPVAECSEIEVEWMGTIPAGWAVDLQSKHPGGEWTTVQTWEVRDNEDRGIFTPLSVGPADIGMELRLRTLTSAQPPVNELTAPIPVNIH